MSSWSRTLALVLALAVMPLQGIAATLSVLYCHGDAQAHALHEQHGHDHAANSAEHHHAGQDKDAGAGGSTGYHLCCNVTVSAPPSMTLPAALPDFPVRTFAPVSFHDLFIPDRPQRPPLA